jgi:ornithine cyclodeaminase/alanine dehydrogenase-like protein (mu-crystallin family)
MLLISEENVEKLLTMEKAITAVEDSYRALGMGEAVLTPRENLWISPPKSIKLASGALTKSGFMGVTAYPGGYGTKGSGPFTTLLYDSGTGSLLAIVQGRFLSWLRTGATTAVATKYMARRDAHEVAIIGTGRQAITQLRALDKVMDIGHVSAFSRTPERRHKFAAQMSAELGRDVVAADDAKSCLAKADVVVTITTSRDAVVKREWLQDGVHINAIGAHYPDRTEIDGETVRGSRVIVDWREQALLEKGEILIPMKQGLVTSGIIAGELGGVVAGKLKGRTSDSEVTLFCSGGIATEEIAVAAAVFRDATTKGIGSNV